MFQALLGKLERRRQREDRPAVLDRYHPASRKRLPVADPVDVVDDRHPRIAWPEEVRVQGVHAALDWHGAACRDQCLGRHLPTEDPCRGVRRADAAEKVVLNALQVQQGHQTVHHGLAPWHTISGPWGANPLSPRGVIRVSQGPPRPGGAPEQG
jgi:hypothetical protein